MLASESSGGMDVVEDDVDEVCDDNQLKPTPCNGDEMKINEKSASYKCRLSPSRIISATADVKKKLACNYCCNDKGCFDKCIDPKYKLDNDEIKNRLKTVNHLRPLSLLISKCMILETFFNPNGSIGFMYAPYYMQKIPSCYDEKTCENPCINEYFRHASIYKDSEKKAILEFINKYSTQDIDPDIDGYIIDYLMGGEELQEKVDHLLKIYKLCYDAIYVSHKYQPPGTTMHDASYGRQVEYLWHTVFHKYANTLMFLHDIDIITSDSVKDIKLNVNNEMVKGMINKHREKSLNFILTTVVKKIDCAVKNHRCEELENILFNKEKCYVSSTDGPDVCISLKLRLHSPFVFRVGNKCGSRRQKLYLYFDQCMSTRSLVENNPPGLNNVEEDMYNLADGKLTMVECKFYKEYKIKDLIIPAVYQSFLYGGLYSKWFHINTYTKCLYNVSYMVLLNDNVLKHDKNKSDNKSKDVNGINEIVFQNANNHSIVFSFEYSDLVHKQYGDDVDKILRMYKFYQPNAIIDDIIQKIGYLNNGIYDYTVDVIYKDLETIATKYNAEVAKCIIAMINVEYLKTICNKKKICQYVTKGREKEQYVNKLYSHLTTLTTSRKRSTPSTSSPPPQNETSTTRVAANGRKPVIRKRIKRPTRSGVKALKVNKKNEQVQNTSTDASPVYITRYGRQLNPVNHEAINLDYAKRRETHKS